MTSDASTLPITRSPLSARLALAGIALYVVLNIVAQSLPPHFNPITQFESDLGAGEFGWLMGIDFVVRGLIGVAAILTIARGTRRSARRTTGLVLLGVWSLFSALLALFPTDITDAATAAGDTGPTVHGLVHTVLAGLGFLSAAAGCIVLAGVLRFRGALTIGIAAAVCIVLQAAVTPVHLAGLVERLFIVLVLLWQALAVVAVSRRGDRRAPADRPAAEG